VVMLLEFFLSYRSYEKNCDVKIECIIV